MYVVKEATQSSRIEGTQTNIDDALKDAADLKPEDRDDWAEVQNYIQAIHFSIGALAELPLCNRLLCQTHARLLAGVRGKHKQPGAFRVSQNWIGVSLKNAAFIPPHHEHVGELMSDLEKLLNDETIFAHPLIRIAIAHYQFETIHPFLDGNGRLGRLMISLYLASTGLLKKPALCLSTISSGTRRPMWITSWRCARATTCVPGWSSSSTAWRRRRAIRRRPFVPFSTSSTA